MNEQPGSATKTFSVDQANAMLPLVRAITEDLVKLGGDYFERQQRLEYLKASHNDSDESPYVDELRQTESELERQRERLQELVDELQELGVEPKSASEGLIDFPTVIDGHPAYLCWQLGEEEVMHWHDLESGFAGRLPLPAAPVADGSAEDGHDPLSAS
jgi:hypothetical protein